MRIARHPRCLLVALLASALLAACAGGSGRPESGLARSGNPASEGHPRARVHTELGAGYYARGQYAVALESLNRALEADAAYAPAYNVLALVRAELREDAKAEAAFQRALELQPGLSEAHNNFGLYLCQRGRVDEAMKHFETALDNPIYATPEKALVNAGACSLKAGALDRAEVLFTRAMKLVPGLEGALLGAAEVDYRRQRWLAARAKLQRAQGGGSLNAQALWLAVRVERALGDADSAAAYGTQLMQRFPESPQTQWWANRQFENNGDWL